MPDYSPVHDRCAVLSDKVVDPHENYKAKRLQLKRCRSDYISPLPLPTPLLPSSIENLWHQTTIGHRDLIANAVLSGRSGKDLFDSSETSRYPVLSPFLLLLLADMDQDDQILQWLNARADNLADLTHLGPLMHILRQ